MKGCSMLSSSAPPITQAGASSSRCKVRLPTDHLFREMRVCDTLPAFCEAAARKLGVSPDGVALFSAEGKALATDRDILTLRDNAELLLMPPVWSIHALSGASCAELLARVPAAPLPSDRGVAG